MLPSFFAFKFISALQRSEELANAMEARGYDPSAERTKYRVSKWKTKDTVSSLIICLILGGCIALMVTKIDVVSLILSLIMG